MKLQSYSTFYCQQPMIKKKLPSQNVCCNYTKLDEEFTTGTFYKCPMYDYIFAPLKSKMN